jgi:deoxyribonuclease-4
MILGAHLPTKGGLAQALEAGREIGASAVQIFTRNQVQWAGRPVSAEEAQAFRTSQSESGIAAVLSHGSYLVNLASPARDILEKSRTSFSAELERCGALGIPHLVFHPGAHLGAGVDTALKTLVESLDRALEAIPHSKVMPLLEVTAGQGSYLGSRFEELSYVLDRAEHSPRLGVCLDTCHLLAAGYDLASPEGYRDTLASFDSIVGFRRLKAVHLNDAKKGLGSHLDRHESIGAGTLGLPAFERIVRDPRFQGLPMILETPGPETEWKREIALLRRMGAS